MSIASMIDHTLLKADSSRKDIEKLCKEAIDFKFASVCVNPFYVAYCRDLLKGTEVKVATVIGFPLGSNTKDVKAYEAKNALENGADELDMVINIGALKNGEYDLVKEDIEAVVAASQGKTVKVIIETCLLNEEEKIRACELAKAGGADFVKTSTGFSSAGANIEDIKLMRKTIGKDMKIKASGGIRDLETARQMKEAGADRIGASASVKIAEDEKNY